MLGFLITLREIEVDPSKNRAILEMSPPKWEKEVRSFLRKIKFINRFIAKLTSTCEHMFKLLKKGVEFQWDNQCQAAFKKVKEYLRSPPILSSPEPGKPLILYLSVTDTVMGCMLAQEREDDVEKAIYYLSKKMIGSEVKYTPPLENTGLLCTTLRPIGPNQHSHTSNQQKHHPKNDQDLPRLVGEATIRLARLPNLSQNINRVFTLLSGIQHGGNPAHQGRDLVVEGSKRVSYE